MANFGISAPANLNEYHTSDPNKNPHSIIQATREASSGFTLIEVLLALAIMGGVLVTAITTINYHLAVASRHETITIGTSLAENLFSEIRNNPQPRKGKFSHPNSDYSFDVKLEETFFPDIVKAVIRVRKDRELITIYGFASR